MGGGIVKSSDIELQCESNMIETVLSNSTTVHVKTLVWEVACNESQPTDSDYPPEILFYIVTALKMSDRVDVSRLQDLVCNNHHELSGRTLHPSQLQKSGVSISMAPTKTAENLTGYQSGCMPPIGHATPMKLYVEESIEYYDTASVGSGSLGHSLLLPTKQLFKCAENNVHGLQVGCFASTMRTESPSSVLEPNLIRQENKPKKLPHRCTEPKDRLKEYKSLKCITEKAQLLRTTSRKKGRVETMKHLIDEAVRTGDFPQLMSTSAEVGVNKNALHLCSWKGDFDTVKYIVETSKRFYPELDLINTVSKSDGNHGKTPIFYALTQCREDVVRYLVSEGASLLYVNNKGQTPCSIAVSHLEEDACQFLYDAEAKELRDGGVFVNYRETNSDGKYYGDLDP